MHLLCISRSLPRCQRKFFYLSYLSLVLFRDARLKFVRFKTKLHHSHCHYFSNFYHHSLRPKTISRFELITTLISLHRVLSVYSILDFTIFLTPFFFVLTEYSSFFSLATSLTAWFFPTPLHRNQSSFFSILHLVSVTYPISNHPSSNLPQMSNCSSW
jgi:hypothetical protein